MLQSILKNKKQKTKTKTKNKIAKNLFSLKRKEEI